MFGVVGIGVNELSRIRIGKLELDVQLDQGQFREITDEELALVCK